MSVALGVEQSSSQLADLHAGQGNVCLLRLFRTEAPFVLGTPTEIPRPQARRTSHIGTLSDGKTKGFCLLMLATPFRGTWVFWDCDRRTRSSKDGLEAQEANVQ